MAHSLALEYSLCHALAVALQLLDVSMPVPSMTQAGNTHLHATHFHMYRARVATTQPQDESCRC